MDNCSSISRDPDFHLPNSTHVNRWEWLRTQPGKEIGSNIWQLDVHNDRYCHFAVHHRYLLHMI